MTCADLRAQVASLQVAADTLVVNAEVQHFPPVLVAQLVEVAGQLAAAKQALDACLLAPLPDRPAGVAPADILQISFDNPAPGVDVADVTTDWTAVFVGTPTSFPQGATAEWMPVVDPGQDWDQHPVGASGWVIAPNFSGADLPFTHPFGRDWEFSFAVDTPEPVASIGLQAEAAPTSAPPPQAGPAAAPGSAQRASAIEARPGAAAEQLGSEVVRRGRSGGLSGSGLGLSPGQPDYSWLVALANQTDTAETAAAQVLQLYVGPHGLLGVEMERGQIPDDFVEHAREGDRIAVFGRWIVDAGHFFHVDKNDDSSPALGYRTEIHPPMLMACAGLRTVGDHTITRTLITSRAYLASEKFIVDTTKINDDSAPDDGYMVAHLTNEVTNVVELKSNQVEAHPKVMSKPFTGRQVFTIILQPPPLPRRLLGVLASTLSISYHFTTRGACTAQLASDGQSVELTLVLDDTDYPLTGLPARSEYVYNEAALDAMNASVGPAYDSAETQAEESAALLGALAGAIAAFVAGTGGTGIAVLAGISALRVKAILDEGVQTDSYAGAEQTPILQSPNPVLNIAPAQLSTSGGLSRDDLQPYPLLGWVELEWVEEIGQGQQQQGQGQGQQAQQLR